jgi:hypothetical protein
MHLQYKHGRFYENETVQWQLLPARPCSGKGKAVPRVSQLLASLNEELWVDYQLQFTASRLITVTARRHTSLTSDTECRTVEWKQEFQLRPQAILYHRHSQPTYDGTLNSHHFCIHVFSNSKTYLADWSGNDCKVFGKRPVRISAETLIMNSICSIVVVFHTCIT